jgi:capsular polysaccharide transport system permease protein
MTSRQAVQDLQQRIGLKERYDQAYIDFWSRLSPSAPMERITRYWRTMTKVEYDTVQGTSSAEVRAFRPDDAYLIARALLALGEDLINEVAQRPQREAIQYAQAEVKRAEDRLKAVWAELSDFRNKSGVIDPVANLVVSNATVAATIRSTLSQMQTEITTLRKQGLSANSSTIQSLQTKLKATEEQLKEVEGQISKTKQSGDMSIGAIVARYEQLDLERQFAQNMVTSTMQSLEQAKANAAAKRLFITAFVQPAVPQISTHPSRLVAVLTVAAASLLLWTIGLLLSRSIKEHLT